MLNSTNITSYESTSAVDYQFWEYFDKEDHRNVNWKEMGRQTGVVIGVYGLLLVVGAAGNIAVLVPLARRRPRGSRGDLAMTHLAIADFYVTCGVIPLKILIGFGLTLCSISDGFIFGQMSGMIDALHAKDNTIPLTEDEISWIASLINITCLMGFALTGLISEIFGRRITITIISLPVCAMWILVYFAQDKTTLILSRIILGTSFGGILMLVVICVGEYKPPNVRPLFLNLISCVGTLIGTALGHLLCIILHWRYVALLALIPSGLSALLPVFWVESPVWLASKGRFAECEKAFRKLRISSDASEYELQLIISYERKKQMESLQKPCKHFFGNIIVIAIKTKYFWKIFGVATTVCVYRVATGRILFSTLAITILQDITGSSDILLFTLVVDGFIILGALLSCFFLRKCKIRVLFFVSGTAANICLIFFGLSLYLYPGSDYYFSWVKVSLLALYFVILTAGPFPILDTLLSEILPVELKSYLIVIIGIISSTSQFLGIKFVPNMLAAIGYHGIFFINAATIFLCLAYLWFTLPETKGRSLHEIEYFFKNNTFDCNKDLFNMEQSSKLLVNSG